jgi:ferredoxin
MIHRVQFQRRRDGQIETLSSEVADGTTLWDAARALDLPVATSCQGASLCARCGLEPLRGADGLSEETAAEIVAKDRGRVDPALRLSCQTRIHGDVTATARYW